MPDAHDEKAKPEHRISPQTGRELQELRDVLTAVAQGDKPADADAEAWSTLQQYYTTLLDGLPNYDIETVEPEVDRIYTIVPIERTSGGRIYRLNVHIDNAFGELIARVRHACELMLERVVAGQSPCFIATALRKGLTWRRPLSLPFPHALPYSSPPPTTPEGRYTEEAAVIAAALHFPLSNAAPGLKLVIDSFSEGSHNGWWTLGNLGNGFGAARGGAQKC